MERKYIKIERLAPNQGQIPGVPKNPRKERDEAEVEKLMRSIEATPVMSEVNPLIVFPFKRKYVVIGGNARLEALRRLGKEECFCCVLPSDTTPAKLKELALKDNTSFGKWDYDELANYWSDMPLEDMGVQGMLDNPTGDDSGEGGGDSEVDTSSFEENMKIVFRFPETEASFVREKMAGKDVKSEIIRLLNEVD